MHSFKEMFFLLCLLLLALVVANYSDDYVREFQIVCTSGLKTPIGYEYDSYVRDDGVLIGKDYVAILMPGDSCVKKRIKI